MSRSPVGAERKNSGITFSSELDKLQTDSQWHRLHHYDIGSALGLSADFFESGLSNADVESRLEEQGYNTFDGKPLTTADDDLGLVMVIRNWSKIEYCNASKLVKGDVILLNGKKGQDQETSEIRRGTIVPADIRLIEASPDFRVNQANLFGTNADVEKNADVCYQDIRCHESANMVYHMTHVSSGNAKGIVVATGPNTLFSQIAVTAVDPNADKKKEPVHEAAMKPQPKTAACCDGGCIIQ